MDKETGFSEAENPWIPATPAKEQPICEAKQENHQTQANWPREERFPAGKSDQACWLELQGIQAQGRASTFGYTNRQFDNGEGALATKSQVYNFFQESADNLRNLPCQSLLALADAATYSVNATNQATDNVTSSSSFTSILSNGLKDIQFSRISATCQPPEHDPSLGSNFGTNGCKENIAQYGCSVLGKPSFDLNSPPITTKDAAATRRFISEFAPMTPEQARHRGESKPSAPNLCVDERTLQDTSQQIAEVGSVGTKLHQLQNHGELSEVPRNNTISSVSTHLQEDHNPDMGGNCGTDLIKTPQHKQRRKRHRPKVVIEGQTKRTPKPTAPNPEGPTVTSTGKRKYVRKNSVGLQTTILSSGATSGVENPVEKRKYVRRKGLSKTTPVLSAEAISGIQNPKQKRKYVRRNGSNKQETTTLDEAIDGKLNPSTTGYTTKSCRRSLNFDSGSQVGDKKLPCNVSLDIELNSGEQNIYADRLRPRSRVVKLGDGIEVTVEMTKVGIAYDLSRSINQDLNSYLSMTEQQSTSPSQSGLTANSLHESTRGRCQIVFSDETHDKDASTAQKMLNANTQLAPRSPNESNCSTSAYLASEQASGQKRDRSKPDHAEHSSTRGIESHCNFQQAYPVKAPLEAYNNENSRLKFFPAIYKKKRTEKGHNSATPSMPYMVTNAQVDANYIKLDHNYIISADQLNTANITTEQTAASDSHNKYHIGECMLALSDKERKTKRRSKGLTRVRNSISLIGILKHKQVSTHARKSTSNIEQTFELLSQPHTCMEALVADTNATMSTKKRTKKNSVAASVPPYMYTRQVHYKLIGAPLDVRRKNILSVDAITEQLKHLDINQEQNALIPYNLKYPEQNALVLYKRDGTLVTFDPADGTLVTFDPADGTLVPFHPIKRQQPKPKVDLDDETIRVWKLLLQDIDNEGIDGTDEEKVKWWKEERRVFRGRADSFIARMHLVQGDRRFSPWKGSVVDSVIGVFLTQNVSDHLSSSAFMALAARYPLKNKMFHEEGTSIVVKEPQDVECNEDTERINSTRSCGSSTLSVSLPEDSGSKLFESPSNSLNVYHESAGSGSSTEITEIVGFMADQREIYDVLPSQSSMVSSQSSVKNPNAELTATSKPRVFDASTSFLELLQKAGNGTLHQVHNQEGDDMSSNKTDGENQSESTCDLLEHMKKPEDLNDSFIPVISPSLYSLHLTSNGVSEVDRANFSVRANNFPNIFEGNEENYASEQSGSSAESARLPSVPKNMTTGSQGPGFTGETDQDCSNLEAEANKIPDRQIVGNQDSKNNLISHFQSQMQQIPDDTNLSGETLDVTESISITNDSSQIIESNLSENCNIFLDKTDGKNANTIEPTRDRIRKDKEKAYDWDGLRKHAQADGKQRERTANTMDSVDWEAVRRADVKEIAKTIKGRGMNNMLAERIKDFLNRLVREHGSIDLEWLRDIPPDKAKEYLLSFWGLGLKSVECVRLLTLHHLAFPVDTNVGRIAVRLGWVPIQPLPESLQLHLLELYPVLESIQKYLWPRLCRLDQRTLYELHYQMITFGKVFCTKSKPNCNACPMRGECRHFASAFASARLALPAPEEKSIVDITGIKASTPSSRGITNPLLLPYTQSGQPPSTLSEGTICEPIIEEPATPEAEHAHVAESDIEDTFYEDPHEIPTIKLNIEEFTQNLQNYMQLNMELQDVGMSKALVALTPEAASIPMPKLKSMSRLRTEHQVYQLPDSHPLLEGLEKRETDDPCPYLLAIWTPGETANSIQPPEKLCSSQESGNLCNETTCFSCSSLREANSQTVRGTLLIPCRTAMRGSFPLNGTYFQVNEVFADHESSLNPIAVPRDWIWNLPRRIVYFGTSIPTIFRGLTTEEIQQCFWRGFVCVRGFDQRKRAPRPLIARLHFPASKLPRTRGKTDDNYVE